MNPPVSPGDSVLSPEQGITLALQLAAQATPISAPNPRVGCVLTRSTGQVLGQGYTQAAGSAHAEVMAIRDAVARGHSLQGATAYVSLEPCVHHGRTGPCCEALIQAGIHKVVASLADPNPLVAGQGFERLRAAGIEVVVGPGAAQSRELNIGFFSRMLRGVPWVRLKIAASLDGITALPNGQSQWITSPEARADGHAWRARACALLTGIGTVLQDNPQLNVRPASGLAPPRQPVRVIVDSQLQTPSDARIFDSAAGVWIYTATAPSAKPDLYSALQCQGAQVICLPNAHGKVDLAAMLHDLGQREINELHVEAGSKLAGALIQAGLVDEFLVYLAPLLLGKGYGMAAWGPLQALSEGLRLQWQSTEFVGPDLRIISRVAGRVDF